MTRIDKTLFFANIQFGKEHEYWPRKYENMDLDIDII